MVDRRTVRIHVRLWRAEHAGWRAKATAAGAPVSALLRQAMAHLDRAGGRRRARAHPAARPHRQQPEPGRALSELTRRGGRGRRGDRPSGHHRAGATRGYPARRTGWRCTLSSCQRQELRTGGGRLSRRRAGRSRATARGHRSRPRRSGHGGGRRRLAGVRAQVHVGPIAWARDDSPTDARIGAVLGKFEQTAWAGLAGSTRGVRAAVLDRLRETARAGTRARTNNHATGGAVEVLQVRESASRENEQLPALRAPRQGAYMRD